MYQFELADYSRVEPLFHDLIGLHGSVKATLNGAAQGRVLVDDLGAPTCALLDGPEGLYLGGSPIAGRDYAVLRAAIPPWAYLYPSPAWLAAPALAMPHPYMQRHERLHLTIRPRKTVETALPLPFRLVIEQDDLFSSAVLLDGEVVAHCRPDLVVGDMIELGVWTRPDMRRRGLAIVVVRESLNLAARASVACVGWHCHASNAGSLAVARRAGFELAASYDAWSASLPAESAGDLDAARCQHLAEAFEAGRHSYDWLDFHAAAAWAEAGEIGRALLAIERLVASPWRGQAEWLSGHWALQRLRHEQRFVRAVETQSRK